MMKWDNDSGVRERLALLADRGPTVKEQFWGYHPSGDYWYSCGPGETGERARHEVNQEGADSLALIEQRWGLDRAAAMARIGHGEDAR